MSISLDPTTTALVLIDLQHGITALDVKPHASSQVVANCARLAEAYRAKGATIVYVRVALGEMVAHQTDVGGSHGSLPPNACEIVPEAGMQPGDALVTKRQWGAFYATELDQILRRRGVKTVMMAGIATNIGVESTARAAFDLGYDLVFAEDAMSTFSAEMQEFAVTKIFPRMGRVRSTEQLLAALPAA
jgi:nicotinamidase-related amidase